MLHIAGSLLVAYVAIVAFLAIFQRSLIYHPPSGPLDQSGLRDAGYAPLDSPASGSPLYWFAAPRSGESRIVVFLHGNAGNVGNATGKLEPLRGAGYGVLLVEYPGFARAAGTPSEASIVAAARGAVAELAARGIASTRLALWGESLGSGPATQIAAESPVAAVILEAPFTSVPARAQELYWWTPARWLVRDRFDNLSRIAAIGAPLLIVHGERDATTPASHGRALLAAAAEPKRGVFFPEAGHVDLPEHGMVAAILRFLDDLAAARKAP